MARSREGLTNIPDSVRQRLRNVAREANENMQVILIRYATERLMYRLSLSKYGGRFVLKGAWLFYVWGIQRRATRDVDLLAMTDNKAEGVRRLFTEVIGTVVPVDDGLVFDTESLQVEEVQLDADYTGLRLRLRALLGDTEIPTQVDLGFSEAVVEEPVPVALPVLLDFEAPELKAYSPEVVVAEKLEAIVKLGTATTRFKDFFDLFLLSNEKTFDGQRLARQVTATFTHRGTPIPGDVPAALGDAFASDPESQRQWRAFLRRSEVTEAPDQFTDAVARVREFVTPVLRAASQGKEIPGTWTPGGAWG